MYDSKLTEVPGFYDRTIFQCPLENCDCVLSSTYSSESVNGEIPLSRETTRRIQTVESKHKGVQKQKPKCVQNTRKLRTNFRDKDVTYLESQYELYKNSNVRERKQLKKKYLESVDMRPKQLTNWIQNYKKRRLMSM